MALNLAYRDFDRDQRQWINLTYDVEGFAGVVVVIIQVDFLVFDINGDLRRDVW